MMNIQVERLTPQKENAYLDLLYASEGNLLYTSLFYRDLIVAQTGAQSNYLVAENEQGQLIGALPLMDYEHPRFGPVINSLPYYGSNGAVMAHPELSQTQKEKVYQQLLHAAEAYARDRHCAAMTLISNPFDRNYETWLATHFNHDHQSNRIGQITPLPVNGPSLASDVLKLFSEPRPRNIRKAIKSKVSVRKSHDLNDLLFLHSVHVENINAIGGKPKERSFFERIHQTVPAEHWTLYMAEREGERVAGLLVFAFNKTVEYYTPATVVAYRNLQPSALIIYQAMIEAAKAGNKYWNWGGTWNTQHGVYNFKRRWGTIDSRYAYFTKVFNRELLEQSPETLLQAYPDIYVLPFDQLKQGSRNNS